MKHHFTNFLSDAGHSVEGYEHKLLQKFAAFVEAFEAKQNEPAPVVEAAAPVVTVAPAPVAAEEPAVVEAVTSNTETK